MLRGLKVGIAIVFAGHLAGICAAQDFSQPVQNVAEVGAGFEGVWTNRTYSALLLPGITQRFDIGIVSFTSDFDTNFLAGLVGSTNGGVCQFTLTAVESNSPHQRVVFNSTGGVAATWAIAYDAGAWITNNFGAMPSYIAADSTNAAQWIADRTPDHMIATLSFMSTNALATYYASMTNSAGSGLDTNGAGVSLLNLYSNSIALVGTKSASPIAMYLHAPASVTNLGVFGTADLVNGPWQLLATVPHSGDPVFWSFAGLDAARAFALGDMKDSDGDGLADAVELFTTHTDPANADTDGDGLTDGQEIRATGSKPLQFSSANDGLGDGWKAANNLNPNQWINPQAVCANGLTLAQLAGMNLPTNAVVNTLGMQDLVAGFRSQWDHSAKVGHIQLDWDRNGTSNGIPRYYLVHTVSITNTDHGVDNNSASDSAIHEYYCSTSTAAMRGIAGAQWAFGQTNWEEGAGITHCEKDTGSYSAACEATVGTRWHSWSNYIFGGPYITNSSWDGTWNEYQWPFYDSSGAKTLGPTFFTVSAITNNGDRVYARSDVLTNEYTTAMMLETATNELAACPSMTNLWWGSYEGTFGFWMGWGDEGEGYYMDNGCAPQYDAFGADLAAERHMDAKEQWVDLCRMQYRITSPASVTGQAYKITVAHLFTDDETTNTRVIGVYEYVTNGTGGEIELTPPGGVTVDPPASNGVVEMSVVKIDFIYAEGEKEGQSIGKLPIFESCSGMNAGVPIYHNPQPDVQLSFLQPLNTSTVDVIEVSCFGEQTNLVETSPASMVFADSAGRISIHIQSAPLNDTNILDIVACDISNESFGLTNAHYECKQTAAGSSHFVNISRGIVMHLSGFDTNLCDTMQLEMTSGIYKHYELQESLPASQIFTNANISISATKALAYTNRLMLQMSNGHDLSNTTYMVQETPSGSLTYRNYEDPTPADAEDVSVPAFVPWRIRVSGLASTNLLANFSIGTSIETNSGFSFHGYYDFLSDKKCILMPTSSPTGAIQSAYHVIAVNETAIKWTDDSIKEVVATIRFVGWTQVLVSVARKASAGAVALQSLPIVDETFQGIDTEGRIRKYFVEMQYSTIRDYNAKTNNVFQNYIRGKNLWYSMSHGATYDGTPYSSFTGLKFIDGGITSESLKPLNLDYSLVVVDGCCSAQSSTSSKEAAQSSALLTSGAKAFAEAWGTNVAYVGWGWEEYALSGTQEWTSQFVKNLRYTSVLGRGRTVAEAHAKFLDDYKFSGARELKIYGHTENIIDQRKD